MKRVMKILLLILLLVPSIVLGIILITHQLSSHGVPVIGYHSVVSDTQKEEQYKDDIYTISQSMFEKQMHYLAKHDYVTLSMQEVEAYYKNQLELPANAICITIDDGHLDTNTMIKPILEKHGFQATAFVIGSKVGQSPTKYAYLDKEDLINDSTMQYYSHSYNLHRKVPNSSKKIIQTLSIDQLNDDFERNKEIVDDTYFAYPFGVSSSNALQALEKQDVSLAFSYNQFRHLTPNDHQYKLPRYMFVDFMPFWYFKWMVN